MHLLLLLKRSQKSLIILIIEGDHDTVFPFYGVLKLHAAAIFAVRVELDM